MLERCVVWLGSGFRGLASALHPARVLLLLLAAGAGGWEAGRSHLGPWKRFSGRPPMEARLCGTYTRFVGRLFRSLRADCAGSGFGGFCWVRAASVQFSPAPNHCKPLQTTANHPARHASRQQQACSNPYQPPSLTARDKSPCPLHSGMACGRLSPTSKRAAGKKCSGRCVADALQWEPSALWWAVLLPDLRCDSLHCELADAQCQNAKNPDGHQANGLGTDLAWPALADLGSAPELKKACRWPLQRHRARFGASPVLQWGRQLQTKPHCSKNSPRREPRPRSAG